tara:strand:- start:60 stop:482 length:423 start_codon:yes stop_codon:yes gene_type:complete
MQGAQVIEGASNYVLTPSGYIYNVNTKRRLKREWIDGRWQTKLKTNDGHSCRVQHDTLHVPSRTPPHDSYTPIPDYQDYAVTPYGAVWKIKNLRGRRGRHPFIVTEYYRGTKPYVRLRNKYGKQHNVPLSRIMEDSFPNS